MKRNMLVGIGCMLAASVCFSQGIPVENFYTGEGGNTAVNLSGGHKCGQRFTATQPFEGVEVNCPTWSVSGTKGMTIRLYSWAGDYAKTVAQKPIAVSVQEYMNDNAWFLCAAPTELQPGEYFWECSEPTNIDPASTDLNVGCWRWDGSKYPDGEAYYDGKPYDVTTVNWTEIFASGQTSENWTPFAFPTTDNPTLSQSFETYDEFSAVGIKSPTWLGTGAGYRITLYKWDTDFATSVSKTPLGQTTFSNIVDNERDDLYLSSPAPAGRYLLVTDQPVRGTGNVGHWGWVNSPFSDDINVMFTDGIPTENYPSLDMWVGYPLFEEAGKDFASRSVTGVATRIRNWDLQ